MEEPIVFAKDGVNNGIIIHILSNFFQKAFDSKRKICKTLVEPKSSFHEGCDRLSTAKINYSMGESSDNAKVPSTFSLFVKYGGLPNNMLLIEEGSAISFLQENKILIRKFMNAGTETTVLSF